MAMVHAQNHRERALAVARDVALTSLMRNEFWENQCLMKFSDLWILTSIVRISLGR